VFLCVQLASSLLGGYKPSLDKLSTAPRHSNSALIDSGYHCNSGPQGEGVGVGGQSNDKERGKESRRKSEDS